MDLAIAISLAGLVGGALWRALHQGAKLIELQVQLREKVNLCLVGIEASGLIDRETTARLDKLEQRVADLERYLQITSQGAETPFVIRHQAATRQ